MAATTRIYLVQDAGGNSKRLVRATHPGHALMHAARTTFDVHVASQNELVDLLGRGIEVEKITGEQQQLPT